MQQGRDYAVHTHNDVVAAGPLVDFQQYVRALLAAGDVPRQPVFGILWSCSAGALAQPKGFRSRSDRAVQCMESSSSNRVRLTATNAMELAGAQRVQQWRAQHGLLDPADFAFAFYSYEQAMLAGGHVLATAWLETRARAPKASKADAREATPALSLLFSFQPDATPARSGQLLSLRCLGGTWMLAVVGSPPSQSLPPFRCSKMQVGFCSTSSSS